MQHFYNSIQGWFDYQELYSTMVNRSPTIAHFVEVGTWKGTSAAYMAVEIINSGKLIRFDCVDTWQGSEEHQAGQPFADQDVINNRLFEVFTQNMAPAAGHYRAVRLPSVDAAANYQDNSLDFVFIDAAHDYESVCNDIKAWLPKVAANGYLGGHDYPHVPVKTAVHKLLFNVEQHGSCWLVKKLESHKV